MEEKLVSVIVPVYNTEKFLVRCLLTLCSQSYKNLQIILVNNMSSDKSPDICREFAKRDSRIEYIEAPAKGVSLARNIGLAHAKGEYVQFVDSDDYLPENSTALMATYAEIMNADMVLSPYFRVIEGRPKLHNLLDIESGEISKKRLLEYLVEKSGSYFWGVLWNKLYKRDIIQKHDLKFYENIQWSEDFIFNLGYIQYAESFYAINAPVYFYVKNKDSVTATMRSPIEIFKIKQEIFLYYEEVFKELGLYEEYKTRLLKYFFAFVEHR